MGLRTIGTIGCGANRARSATFSPWVMDHTEVTKSHGSWGIRRRSMACSVHDPWGVWLLIGHGPYGDRHTHGLWTVRW